jgi:hypothetical protein
MQSVGRLRQDIGWNTGLLVSVPPVAILPTPCVAPALCVFFASLSIKS